MRKNGQCRPSAQQNWEIHDAQIDWSRWQRHWRKIQRPPYQRACATGLIRRRPTACWVMRRSPTSRSWLPDFMQTRAEVLQRQRVLLLADTTDINLSTHESTTGGGPIGRGNKAQGFFVHTVLAMDAEAQQVLGCIYQEPFVRQGAPKGETKAER